MFDFYKSKKVIFDNKEDYLNEMKNYFIDIDVNSEGLIRWDKLSHKYHGVEFNNYHKNRKTPNWYNTLDVNSGCVWNMKAVQELTLLGSVVEYDDLRKTNIWVLNDKGKEFFNI
jgi:hypothetical protein